MTIFTVCLNKKTILSKSFQKIITYGDISGVAYKKNEQQLNRL